MPGTCTSGRDRARMGAAANGAAATNLNLPLASGAHPLTVRCTLTGTHTEGAATVRTYQLSATACQPAAAGACPNAVTRSDYVAALASGSSERWQRSPTSVARPRFARPPTHE